MTKARELNPRETAFCVHFTTIVVMHTHYRRDTIAVMGMFMFIIMLFNFAETGDPSAAPVVTIPAG